MPVSISEFLAFGLCVSRSTRREQVPEPHGKEAVRGETGFGHVHRHSQMRHTANLVILDVALKPKSE